jgi:uncharacterized protein (TIGR02597 family)
MRTVVSIVLALALPIISATTTQAVDVVTDPVGFYSTPCLSNSDTYVSIPFIRPPEALGMVGSWAGNTITISNVTWTPGQWATPSTPNGYYPYYVQLLSGSKEGAYYTITNSGTSTLSVILNPEDLTSVAVGDRVQICPFWTLNTVYPGGTGVVASVSAASSGRRTSILFPNMVSNGINLGVANEYYYYNGAWRRSLPVTPSTSNFNDVVILPDQYIIVRQNNSADTTTNTAIGQVLMTKARIPLYANTDVQQDNAIGLYRPSVQTLNDTGLTNAFTASVGTASSQRRDTLLIFDNTQQTKNKGASQVFYYYNSGWRRALPVTPSSVDFGQTNVLTPGMGFIIRKYTNSTPTWIWVNSANYTNN